MRPSSILPGIFFLHFLLAGSATAQVTQSWLAQYNPGKVANPPTAMVADAAGNLYITATYISGRSVLNDRDETQIVTFKYNSAGVRQWSNFLGNATQFASVAAIAIDAAGNTYITGSEATDQNGDITVVATEKIDPDGNTIWTAATQVGPIRNTAAAIAVDASGNVYVTGTELNTNSNNDYLLVKLNANGVQQWTVTYDGTAGGYDQANAIALDAAGNIYITGQSTGRTILRFGPGRGITEFINTGYDFLTIKYNTAGTALWTARYNGTGNTADIAHALVPDAAGNVYVTGESGTSGMTIAYGPDGTQLWATANITPNAASTKLTSIALSPSGNIVTAGFAIFTAGEASTEDYLTSAYSPAGVLSWNSYLFGDQPSGGSNPVPLAVDNQGNSYIAAPIGTSSTFNFATVKYSPTGVQDWLATYNSPDNGPDIPSAIAIVNPPAFSGLFAQTSIYVTGSSDLTYTTIKYTQPRTIVIRPLNSGAAASTTGTDPALALTSSLANYPNPFHGATNIVYTLPNDSHVTLRIFDATGKSVATLLDEDELAGEHILPYSAGRLAAGVYEYQIIAMSAQGEFSAVKQMVVR